MIKCTTCGLENLDHMTVCVECGNPLIHNNDHNVELLHTPPRAGKYKKLRLFLYKIRRNTGALNIERQLPEEKEESFSLRELLLDLGDSKGVMASIIPGLGHFTQKRFLRGLIFFALWFFLILLGIFFYGRTFSNVCFGSAIAVHASAAFDCLPLALPLFDDFKTRIVVMLLLIIIGISSYYWIFNRVNDQVFGVWMNFNRGEPVIMKGEFILIKKQSKYKRGDLLFFQTNGEGFSAGYDQNFYMIPGIYFDRLIGFPGEKIEIIKGKIFINDTPLREELYPIKKKAIRDMTIVLKDNQYFIYDSLTPIQNTVPVELLLLHNKVNKDNIRGKAFMVYAPFSKMKFL